MTLLQFTSLFFPAFRPKIAQTDVNVCVRARVCREHQQEKQTSSCLNFFLFNVYPKERAKASELTDAHYARIIATHAYI